MKKRIVAVTGASGVIGRVVVKELLKLDCQLRVLLRAGSVSYWENNPRVEVIRGEVTKTKVWKSLVKDTWGVIHLAAEMDASLPWSVFESVNIKSVSWALKYLPKGGRMVVASSVVVYEDTGKKLTDENGKIRDNGGVDKYVESKIQALKIIRQSPRRVITVMPSTVVDEEIFGREKYLTRNALWSWVWQNIGGGIPGGLMAAVGSGSRIMNFVEVKDVARGIVAALEKGRVGEEYILAGENIRADEYLKRMSLRCHKRYLKVRIPMFLLGWFGLGKVVNMNFSSDKAKRELGYQPSWRL